MQDIIKEVQKEHIRLDLPKFKAGDTVVVYYKIIEGDKERIQPFQGIVIQVKGSTTAVKTFTVRKISGGIGIERIFPMNSPRIEKVEVKKVGKVRRAKLYYLRDLQGKKARIKEKKAATHASE